MLSIHARTSDLSMQSQIALNKSQIIFSTLKKIGIIVCLGIFSRIFIVLLFYAVRYFANSDDTFTQMIYKADSAFYLDIVQSGYATITSGNPGTWSFFPIYPILAKLVEKFSHFSSLTSLIFASHLSFIISLPIFYFYVEKFVEPRIAWFSTLLVAFSPHSIYFSIPYAESTYFLLILLTMYLARANHPISTGISGAMLSATRPLGVFTIFAVLAVQCEKYGWRSLFDFSKKRLPIWFGLLLFPFGLFAYMAYLNFHTGFALGFKYARMGWNVSYKFPFIRIINKYMFHNPMFFYYSVLICFSLFGTYYLIKKRLWGDAIILFITPFMMTMMQNNFGMPRFLFALYPIYIVLGFLTRGSYVSRVTLFLFCLLANIYYVWGWFYGREFIG